MDWKTFAYHDHFLVHRQQRDVHSLFLRASVRNRHSFLAACFQTLSPMYNVVHQLAECSHQYGMQNITNWSTYLTFRSLQSVADQCRVNWPHASLYINHCAIFQRSVLNRPFNLNVLVLNMIKICLDRRFYDDNFFQSAFFMPFISSHNLTLLMLCFHIFVPLLQLSRIRKYTITASYLHLSFAVAQNLVRWTC
jgi:hypothetical protein